MKWAIEPRRLDRLVLHQGDGLVLPVVVPQHELADLVGHRGELRVARLRRSSSPRCTASLSRILMFTS